MLARQSVWWPGLSRDVHDLVKNCRICARESVNKTEPLIPTQTPFLPWQKVASDLFKYKKKQHFIVIDYYSRFKEVAGLT